MKKIKNLITILAIALSLFACEEGEFVSFNDTSFVQIEDASALAITENSGQSVTISAILGAPQSTDITVNFDVSGADASRYTLSSSSVVIPAGDTSGSITFEAVDNDDIDGDVDVVVALASSSGLPIGIGGEGFAFVSKTISIIDDNIPCNNYVITVVADRWGSEVIWDILDSDGSVVVSGGPYSDLGDGLTTTDEVNVTLPDGCYTFRAFDWYGDGWSAGGASYSAVCGSLTAVTGDDNLDGIPGLDISTVPINPLYGSQFRAASATSGAAPYANHAEQAEFCVNQ